MQSPNSNPLRTVYNRYGPTTDRSDIAAGYAAVLGAVCVSALYITSVWFVESGIFDLNWSPYFAALEFNWVVYSTTVGLAFAVPAAFLVGAVGWRIVPTQTAFSGALKGTLGAVATYFVTFVPALVKYIVGESENCSDNLFQCLSTRFAEDSSAKLEGSEIRCQFVL